MAGRDDGAAIEAVRAAAVPLTGEAGDWDALLELVGDARFVLLGEATHGTHEFYRARAEITRRLIVEKGFTAVAVEADWPDAYRVNRYVREKLVPAEALVSETDEIPEEPKAEASPAAEPAPVEDKAEAAPAAEAKTESPATESNIESAGSLFDIAPSEPEPTKAEEPKAEAAPAAEAAESEPESEESKTEPVTVTFERALIRAVSVRTSTVFTVAVQPGYAASERTRSAARSAKTRSATSSARWRACSPR